MRSEGVRSPTRASTTDEMRMPLDVDDRDVVQLDVQELIDRRERPLDLHAVLELDADLS